MLLFFCGHNLNRNPHSQAKPILKAINHMHTNTLQRRGTRIEQNNNGKIISYLVDPNASLSRVLTTKTSEDLTKIYVYGIGLISEEEMLNAESSNKTYANFRQYHFDYRGSTIALTDDDAHAGSR